MTELKIDNKRIRAPEGQSLLRCAADAGIHIPSMCDNGELEHFTSCMICLVKDRSSNSLIPACSTDIRQGMDIVSADDEIRTARKTALELLLSEHAGDCEAPCRIACPAFMDIPGMNRLLADGKEETALEVIREHIALPAVLGRICHAPCEKACKRSFIDEAVSVCLLKRYAADKHMHKPVQKKEPNGRQVAVAGAGPAGLAAAFHLQQQGFSAHIYDRNHEPGGRLRYGGAGNLQDKSVLDREIAVLASMGVIFNQEKVVDDVLMDRLCREYSGVVLACKPLGEPSGEKLPDKVFQAGKPDGPARHIIRALAQGRKAGMATAAFLQGNNPPMERKRFNSTLGKLVEEEFHEYLKEGSSEPRQTPVGASGTGFTGTQAAKEASRCLHCDCRKPADCKLRNYAEAYGASKKRFSYTQRKPVRKMIRKGVAVFEPGKCIKCGICVRLTAKHNHKTGMTFIGKGFEVIIGTPFNKSLGDSLENIAETVVNACPTGALANP